jgi:hypothetical protein
MKEANIHMATALLLRQGHEVYRTCFSAGFDLLVKKRDTDIYARVLVLSVPAPKPIVSLVARAKDQYLVLRPFDILFAINLETLTCWQIPEDDLPEKSSLYLSRKYDRYRLQSFVPHEIHKPERKQYMEVQKVIKQDIQELEKLQASKETGYEDVQDLLS